MQYNIVPFLPGEIVQRISEFCDTKTQIAMEQVGTKVTLLKGNEGDKWNLNRISIRNFEDFRYVKFLSLGAIFWNSISKYENVDFTAFAALEVLDISAWGQSVKMFNVYYCSNLKILNVLGCKGLDCLTLPYGIKYLLSDSWQVPCELEKSETKIIGGSSCGHGYTYGETRHSCDEKFDPMIDSGIGHIAWNLVCEIIPEIHYNIDVANQSSKS